MATSSRGKYNITMSTIFQPPADLIEIAPLHRFRTSDYIEMIDKGVLGPDDHVELIGGMIVEMSPAGIPHNHYLSHILRLFAPLLAKFEIAIQGTLNVSEGHVLDPDVMLLRQRPDGYKSKLPEAADVQLIIEAAESSLRRDQQIKLPIYAAAAIQEYWIADLEREIVIVHREPGGNGYSSIETLQGDNILSPLAAPDLALTVRQMFE
jgi:Uma2 family endonuclease